MAPSRPARADIIREDSGEVVGVLICRAEGSAAQSMAIAALEVDLGWEHDAAVEQILAASVLPGRWFKTPDRNSDVYAWQMVKAPGTPRSGATPGVLYSWA